MDVQGFYQLFSATCLALVGLWWGVVAARPRLLTDPASRAEVGGVYLAFLLPGLMGLLAQVGGTGQPLLWRVSFAVGALLGAFTTYRVLRRDAGRPGAGWFARARWVVVALYAVVAVIAVTPGLVAPLGVTPLQAEATLLILLVATGHGLVWELLGRPESAA